MGFMLRSRPKDAEILKQEFKDRELTKLRAERADAKLAKIRAEARREAQFEVMSRPERAKARLTSAGRKASSIFGTAGQAGKKVVSGLSKFNDGFKASGFGSNIRKSARRGSGKGLQSQLFK